VELAGFDIVLIEKCGDFAALLFSVAENNGILGPIVLKKR